MRHQHMRGTSHIHTITTHTDQHHTRLNHQSQMPLTLTELRMLRNSFPGFAQQLYGMEFLPVDLVLEGPLS